MRFFIGPRRWFPWDRNDDGQMKDSSNSESALEVLNKRYAQGEISKEDYERIKKDILS
jgi:putative membrane protein